MPTLPFDITSSANDALAVASAATYPPGSPGFDSAAASNIYACRGLTGGTYYVGNALFRFDTTAIPDSAVINSAQLAVYIFDLGSNTDSLSLVGEFYNWPSDATAYTLTPASDAFSVPVSTFTSGAAVYTIPFTGLSGINPAGNTSLRLHQSALGGNPNTAPTGFNICRFRTFEDLPTYPTARLTVDYTDADTTPPAAPTGLSATLLGG